MNSPTTSVAQSEAPVTKPAKSSSRTRRAKPRKKSLAVDPALRAPKRTVGIDVSERTVQICEIDLDGQITEIKMSNTRDRLREYFEGQDELRIVLEVGSHSRWITELLRDLKHQVLVADPRRLKLISATLYKDDRLDAETLAMLGRESAHLLKTVEPRKLPEQQALTLGRLRRSVVKARTLTVNAIRGVMKPYGIRIRGEGRRATFAQSARENLTPELAVIVEPMLQVLETLNAQVAEYDKQAEKLLPVVAPKAAHLTEIPGVGALTALYFAAVVGDPKRFSNSRDIGAYLGLCPKRDDSGERKSALRITKAGDSYMRALLANCATHILGPFGKDSDLRRWGLKKQGAGSKAEKRKAKVALARKLAVTMLAIWKAGQPYKRFRAEPEEKPHAS